MQTMAMIADDLAAWLVALVADAGRKKLTEILLGGPQERALRTICDAAIRRTAADLCPAGGEAAEELVRVIGEVFRAPEPGRAAAEGDTLLAAITAGVTARIALLGDAGLTGVSVSSADVLGLNWRVIAERLNANLVRQILAAAAGEHGEPLVGLARQLNDDRTHLSQDRDSSKLDVVSADVSSVLDATADIRDLLTGAVRPATLVEFAADVRALLARLAWQAEHGRLPPYLSGRAEVMSLARQVRVRAGIRHGGVPPGADVPGRVYAPAADRDDRADRPPRPWGDVAAGHDRLIVLADPGLGKSWLIRTETRRLAGRALDRLAAGAADDVIVPVPLRCDQLAAATGTDLPARCADFLVAQGLLPERSRAPMTARIAGGQAVLLLDALDELTSAEAGTVRTLVQAWAEGGGQARCVITSRIAGYTGSPLAAAEEVELQPFTTDDSRAFIRAWQLPAHPERLLLARTSDLAVAAMARIPLLLAMLCALAADEPPGRALPATRGQLYERVLRWFLTSAHRGADDPASAPLTDVQVEQLLGLLAPIAFTFATWPEGWTDLMPASSLLNAIRSGRAGVH